MTWREIGFFDHQSYFICREGSGFLGTVQSLDCNISIKQQQQQIHITSCSSFRAPTSRTSPSYQKSPLRDKVGMT